MQCPHCLKEISDNASFCGFCGKTISRPDDAQGLPSLAEVDPAKVELLDKKGRSKTKKTKVKKKHIGLKILLIFLIIALLSGFTLGFLCARGVININGLINKNQMKWTDFSEAYIEDEQIIESEDSGEKEASDEIPTVYENE